MIDLKRKMANARRLRIGFLIGGIVLLSVGLAVACATPGPPAPVQTETGFVLIVLGIVGLIESRRFNREIKTDEYVLRLLERREKGESNEVT